MKRTFIGLVHLLDADVAVPDVVAMVLHADVTLVVVSAAVVQEFEGQGPVLLAELGGLQHIGPLLGPQVVLEDLHVVLEVHDGALVAEDLDLVP